MFGGGALEAKMADLGSQEAHFLAHSSATGKKIAEMRFQKRAFAAQMTASKHALKRESL